jgi:hypothetical protein
MEGDSILGERSDTGIGDSMMQPHVTKSSLVLGFSLAVIARSAHADDRCFLRVEVTMAPSVGTYGAPGDGTEIGYCARDIPLYTTRAVPFSPRISPSGTATAFP